MTATTLASTEPSGLDRRLSASLLARASQNFFTHSAHVPLMVLILEYLLSGGASLREVDSYFLLLGALVQALVYGVCERQGRPQPFFGNLVGPLIYSLVEAGLEGTAFFGQPQHLTYWGFSLAFAVVQSLQAHWPRLAPPLVLLENVLRASIPLVMYALVEVRSGKDALLFFADQAHVFLAIALLLLGVLLGFADLAARRSLAALHALAGRLGRFSTWSLGRDLLDRAIGDETALALARRQRAVLFMDLRGFTAWSEAASPELVVDMLNAYYRQAERVLAASRPVKIKYTADEVLAVFASAEQALLAGRALLSEMPTFLARYRLGAGIGVHFGPVVEGVLGGDDARAYDVIGDTVNTAQRLCDAAAAGEMLVSAAAGGALLTRQLTMKGKALPMAAAVEVAPVSQVL